MNYLYSRFACFLFLIFLNLSTAYAQEYEGRVVGIADGDTLVLLTPEKRQIKVRLAEIGLWGATEQKTDLSFTKAVQTVRYVTISGILTRPATGRHRSKLLVCVADKSVGYNLPPFLILDWGRIGGGAGAEK